MNIDEQIEEIFETTEKYLIEYMKYIHGNMPFYGDKITKIAGMGNSIYLIKIKGMPAMFMSKSIFLEWKKINYDRYQKLKRINIKIDESVRRT